MKVLGEEEVEVTDDFKGRIGAQTAKQVIFQKLRDAEREMTYEEFAGREGDVVTGIVQQQERRYTLLDLGKVEALLPQAEQVPSEPYRHGERLKAYITEVRKGTKGPQIVVSRSHPGLLKALFAMEVPEIEEGIVEIRARGARTRPPFEDRRDLQRARGRPRGRLRGAEGLPRPHGRERAPWREDRRGPVVATNPGELVANALQPAKVKEVRIDEATGTAMVIVPDYQLSLAIGKEGQNARLAARLTGWRIDIKSETQVADEAKAPGRRARAPPPERGRRAGHHAEAELRGRGRRSSGGRRKRSTELAAEEAAVEATDEVVAEEAEAPEGV